MKFHDVSKILILSSPLVTTLALAKGEKRWFDEGLAKYMASNCYEAREPLYQATQSDMKDKNRAYLYLAHCQSIFKQNDNAAFNLTKVDKEALNAVDKKLYSDLKKTHATEIQVLEAFHYSLTTYLGQGSTDPATAKGASQFYGASFNVSQDSWSLGAGLESFALDLVPTSLADYSQSMATFQAGYFLMPKWRASGSFTTISGSSDQLKSVSVIGLQTDYYFAPAWSLFVEGYSSKYPTLMANSDGTYKFPVDATQLVAGLGFPIYNEAGYGFNGTVSYTSISLNLTQTREAVVDQNLNSSASRFETMVSSYVGLAHATLTLWSGSEVLGVRSRGAVVSNSTNRYKSGLKLSTGYTFNKNIGVSASYGNEIYTGADADATTYRDFTSNTITGMLHLNW